ncbi:hypothetical protein MYMAC_005279 [Corallococcus macrosporus DSM 14697]|uniref:Uncharacterized protein n=1 Tax=Corallococcus macrosporus DSM 14697 TaxID=1189310 RepID=A0A250K0L4_9BACT|nr:hypothetical protein MYMAC_005279 [Corallococcus macrosporus DSM 14697]
MHAAQKTLHRLLGTAEGLLWNAVAIPLTLYRVLRPGRKDRERAQRNAELLITACRAYQAKHGQLPDALERLVPELLPELPPWRPQARQPGMRGGMAAPAPAGWTAGREPCRATAGTGPGWRTSPAPRPR